MKLSPVFSSLAEDHPEHELKEGGAIMRDAQKCGTSYLTAFHVVFASTLVRKQPGRIKGALLFLLEAVAVLPAMPGQPLQIESDAGRHLVNALRLEPSQRAAVLATLPDAEELTAIHILTALAQAVHAKHPKP